MSYLVGLFDMWKATNICPSFNLGMAKGVNLSIVFMSLLVSHILAQERRRNYNSEKINEKMEERHEKLEHREEQREQRPNGWRRKRSVDGMI